MGRSIIGLVTALTMLVAGCTHVTETPDTSPMPAVVYGGTDPDAAPCDLSNDPGYTPHVEFAPLPADAVLKAVDRCRVADKRVFAGDGEWQMMTTEHADSGLDALAAALRMPSERRVQGVTCVALIPPQLVFAVTDQSGRVITPAQPQAVCGGPLPVVGRALDALPWRVISTRKAWQVRTQLEVGTGCASVSGNQLAEAAARGQGPSPPAHVPAKGRPPLRVCRYAYDPKLTAGNGVPNDPVTYAGGLTGGSTLDGEPAQRVLDAIYAAPPAAHPCSDPAVPFALVYNGQPGQNFVVELGGCYQMLDADGYIRQLDPATVAVLAG